jgi:hypothetical protein
MPNFKSDTVTAQELAASNAGKIIADAPLISGKLHFIQGKLTAPAGTVIADTFEIAKIPAGVTIVPGLSSITGAGAGASTTMSLGFTGEVAAVAAATAISAAGTKPLTGNVGSYKNNTRRSLVGVLGGGALTEGVVIYFNIACVIAE